MINSNDITNYTDCYFTKSKEALKYNSHDPLVVWQVFQKTSGIFCGLELIKPFLETADEVHTLFDGDSIEPFEPAMIIKARAQSFIEFETVYLGILARCSRIASNVRRVVDVAGGKPVLFFPARFDVPETQYYDGYAAACGGAAGCATPMQQLGHNLFTKRDNPPVGTMPHALIAAHAGDTVEAALAFAYSRPNEDDWVLVDFHNDCAKTAVEVFRAFEKRGLKLTGVRLDTSEKLVDAGYRKTIPVPNDLEESTQRIALLNDHGVCEGLVWHVRQALDAAGAQNVKIAVSGGFKAEKVARFEAAGVPADVYAVGESFLAGSMAYTSDIVARFEGARMIPAGKVGRELKTSNRLKQIKGITVPV